MTQKDDNNDNNKKDNKGGIDTSLIEKIESLEQEISLLNENLEKSNEEKIRAIADMMNIRKRAEKDKLSLPQKGMELLLSSILPIIDGLELAVLNKPKESNEWVKGIETIFNSFGKSLKNCNIEKIHATGVNLDTKIHEVVSTSKDYEKNQVGVVLQSGYKIGDTVIRVAKVVIGE